MTTSVVVVCPAAVVLVLAASGLVTSTLALSLLAVAFSVAASYLGAAAWKRRAASGDLLFGDLMLWGWVRRWRFERLLAHSAALVGRKPDVAAPPALSRERRVRLLERLSRALELRDPRTHGHSRRVARHAAAIAKRMALPGDEVARIRTAAVLHDVGKIDTPKEILDKEGPLSTAEYEVVKRHAPVGAQMVAALGDPRLTEIVRNHHERLDGGGYPDGLAGEEIPLGSRIIAVADTFDAVTSARPYRLAMSHRQALDLLTAEAGTQLDPDAVRSFRRYYSGHRPVALWAALLALPRQAGYLLLDLPRFGSALTGAKVAAASLATVAIGTAVVQPAAPAEQPPGNGAVAAQRFAAGPPAPGSARGRGSDPAAGNQDGHPDGTVPAVEVSNPAEAGGTTTGSSPSPPAAAADDGDSGGDGDSGDGTAAAGSTDPPASPPASSGSGSGAGSPTAPVESTASTVAPTVTSGVNSTLEGVGNTVNQVTAPVVESVNGIVGQASGGLLGGGK